MNDMRHDSALPGELQQNSNDKQNEKRAGWFYKAAPVALLVVGIATAWYLMNTAPRAGTVKAEPKARLVNVAVIEAGNFLPVVSVSGEVKAAQKMSLYPQVNGRVEALGKGLLPGSIVKADEELITLDAIEYELAVREKQVALDKATAELQQEEGQQAIARREYALMGQKLAASDEALVLRKPQLAVANAAVDSARVQLEQAQLDLDRTVVKAPFKAQISSRNIELGSEVNTGTALMELVSTDEFWLEVSVPLEQLQWIVFPADGRSGSTVKVTNEAAWGVDSSREGQVLSLLPELESGSRMARVLISIKDPLAQLPKNQGKSRVLVNDFLQADIEGQLTDNLVSVPREWLRDGDHVWLINAQGALEIRKVDVRFRGRDKVLLSSGLNTGERLVTTMLPVAVEGMPLRTLPAELARQEQNAQNKESS